VKTALLDLVPVGAEAAARVGRPGDIGAALTEPTLVDARKFGLCYPSVEPEFDRSPACDSFGISPVRASLSAASNTPSSARRLNCL
jgi:hypothetical protein